MILCSRRTHYVLLNSVTLTAVEIREQSLVEYTFGEVRREDYLDLPKCFISLINYV